MVSPSSVGYACFLVGLLNKFRTDFDGIYWKGGAWLREKTVTFWCWPRSWQIQESRVFLLFMWKRSLMIDYEKVQLILDLDDNNICLDTRHFNGIAVQQQIGEEEVWWDWSSLDKVGEHAGMEGYLPESTSLLLKQKRSPDHSPENWLAYSWPQRTVS